MFNNHEHKINKDCVSGFFKFKEKALFTINHLEQIYIFAVSTRFYCREVVEQNPNQSVSLSAQSILKTVLLKNNG